MKRISKLLACSLSFAVVASIPTYFISNSTNSTVVLNQTNSSIIHDSIDAPSIFENNSPDSIELMKNFFYPNYSSGAKEFINKDVNIPFKNGASGFDNNYKIFPQLWRKDEKGLPISITFSELFCSDYVANLIASSCGVGYTKDDSILEFDNEGNIKSNRLSNAHRLSLSSILDIRDSLGNSSIQLLIAALSNPWLYYYVDDPAETGYGLPRNCLSYIKVNLLSLDSNNLVCIPKLTFKGFINTVFNYTNQNNGNVNANNPKLTINFSNNQLNYLNMSQFSDNTSYSSNLTVKMMIDSNRLNLPGDRTSLSWDTYKDEFLNGSNFFIPDFDGAFNVVCTTQLLDDCYVPLLSDDKLFFTKLLQIIYPNRQRWWPSMLVNDDLLTKFIGYINTLNLYTTHINNDDGNVLLSVSNDWTGNLTIEILKHKHPLTEIHETPHEISYVEKIDTNGSLFPLIFCILLILCSAWFIESRVMKIISSKKKNK